MEQVGHEGDPGHGGPQTPGQEVIDHAPVPLDAGEGDPGEAEPPGEPVPGEVDQQAAARHVPVRAIHYSGPGSEGDKPQQNIQYSVDFDGGAFGGMQNISHQEPQHVAMTSGAPRCKVPGRQNSLIQVYPISVVDMDPICRQEKQENDRPPEYSQELVAFSKFSEPERVGHQGRDQEPLHVEGQVPGVAHAAHVHLAIVPRPDVVVEEIPVPIVLAPVRLVIGCHRRSHGVGHGQWHNSHQYSDGKGQGNGDSEISVYIEEKHSNKTFGMEPAIGFVQIL